MNEHKKIEYVKCNLCGSDNTKELYSSGNIKFVKCNNCSLIYRNPRLEKSESLEFYAFDYYVGYKGIEERISDARLSVFKKTLSELKKEIKSNSKTILDIGCGQGHFLKLAKDFGWQVEGVELAQSACKYAKENFGIEIKNKDLKEANFTENYFHVVTLWNVLDHLLDPLKTLKEIQRILKPGGILVVRVNNVNFHLFILRIFSLLSLLIRVNKLQNPAVIQNYGFSNRTINKILKEQGFREIRVYNSVLTYGDPYKCFGKYSSGIINLLKIIYHILSCFIYYVSFKNLTISSSLLVYAKK